MKAAVALAAMSFALASCGGPKQVTVDHAWVRLPAVAGHPAAAYFELHGGPVDETLIAVTSPAAIRSQMHRSMEQGGMASMAPVEQVAVPAGATTTFAPGGKHVMLFDLDPAVKPGGKVALHFAFADGTQLDYQAQAVAAAAPVPTH